ncbi:T9SS type A sorting domain-containing protein [uncultured Polaribacter sp.]|uniref:T9SS type A sorting domain-containing protein n=1 Tax=uncultured Polaribacter sp. TaxID=174711 RepID=UPI002635A284|nr:T9SS type A sorting domain-containing protein [uncultured Polaribacter sp.]
MKKITLLFALLTTSIGFSQQQEYHLDFEDGTASGNAASWNNSFGGTSAVEIITNPNPSGTNTSATTKVLKTTLASPLTAENYAGFDNSQSGEVFGTWKIDMAVANNLMLTMDVHKNYVGTVGIKMTTTTGGTTFEISDQNVNNSVVNEWQTLTWDLSGINPNGDLTNISDMVVFVDFQDKANRTSPATYELYIDNIKFNAEKLSDAPAASCTDGIMNGDETGVDCGGSCDPCAVELSIASPTVQHGGTAGTDYISIYSDALTSITVGNLDPNWNQATDATEIVINGNNTLKYDNLNYQGTDFNGDKQDVTGMTHFHLDYYTDNTTELEFFLISNAGETAYNIQSNLGITTGSWVSLEIPISNWTLDLTTLREFKVVGNGTIYFDNFYFYNQATASVENNKLLGFSMYPNPASNRLNISAVDVIKNADIFNVIGKKVKHIDINNSRASIDISDLSTGIYLIKYSVNNKVGTAKFIKQ